MKNTKFLYTLLHLAMLGMAVFLCLHDNHGVTIALLGGALLDSHRKAYGNAVSALQSDKQYIVNNERLAMKEGLKNIRLAQSFLCSEIPMNVNTSSYVLNVIDQQYNVGNNNLLPTEIRLKQQDVFFTYALQFYIRIANGWQNMPYQIMTFPSPMLQGPAPLFFPDVASLLGIWTAGRLNVSVNGDVLTPAWDLSQHLCINQSQTLPGRTGANWYDQVSLQEDGSVIVEPNWIINGGNNNIYQVTYGTNYGNILGGVNATTSGTVNIFLGLKWYGFTAQNASSIMNNAPLKGA